MRVLFMGSGAFGLPTLEAIASGHELVGVVSQPDRPAGRARRLRPTPIGEWALANDVPIERFENINEDDAYERVRALAPDAVVVIAFGQKLGERVRTLAPTVNLHASLLPAWRGAAPINRAMMAGDRETGVSVIALAERMDAGLVYTMRALAIDPRETAGELHDRLAQLGPDAISNVLDSIGAGTLAGRMQDEALVTRAGKLSRAEATVSFDQPAERARARIHGLTPWPGCDVRLGEKTLRLLRVEAIDASADLAPGTLDDNGAVACRTGALRVLSVKPAGGRAMDFDAWRNGNPLAAGERLESIT